MRLTAADALECKRERQRRWARKDRAENPERSRDAVRRHAEAHPEQAAARHAVNNAIRDGRLERQLCEVCGKYAHAHHDDYSRPLDVRWLCAVHHKEAHA